MTIIKPDIFLAKIKLNFHDLAQVEIAEQKIRYMKNHFDFYGLKAPIWTGVLKQLYSEFGMYSGEQLNSFIYLCFDDEYREIQYAAIQMVEKNQKKTNAHFIKTLEWMIINKSWWDSVDWIAKIVGIHFNKYPDQIIPFTAKWISSNNMWLQRVAIIFQLRYKLETNEKLLFEYCTIKANDTDFFIRKAIGWALRQYSKTNPLSVIRYVEKQELSVLSKKEALRLIEN